MAPSSVRLEEIKLTDVDFEAVAAATDKNVIKRYIKLLEEDGSYFEELLRACKNKLLEIAPKDYALMYPRATSDQEIHEATQDLLNWEDSVSQTDAALLKSRKGVVSDEEGGGQSGRYPIRGQEASMIARPNIKRGEIKEAPKEYESENDILIRDKAKMKDYYAAWDKVDVEAIEEEMDEEDKKVEEAKRVHFDDVKDEQRKAKDGSGLKKHVDDVPEAHKKHMADSNKEKGNEAFYCKDYEEAEVYYSHSIHFGPGDPSTWSNRALTRLKLGNAQGSLEDCDHALAINGKYMKALHRRGKALYELARYEDAVRSFQLALAESPGNTQINGDLMVARRKLRSDGAAPPTGPSPRVNDPSSCVIEELTEEATPAPGYTRVAIEEDSESDEEISCDTVPSAKSAGSAAPAKPKFHKVVIEEGSDSDSDGPSPASPSAAAPSGGARIPSPAAGSGGFRKVQVVEESDSEEEAPAAAAAPKAPSAGFHKVQIVEASDSEGEDAPAAGAAAAKKFQPPPRVAEKSSAKVATEAEDGGDVCLDGMD